MTKVVLVDAGGSNIGSVRYALQRLGVDAELTGDAATIRAADRVILPGVGAAAGCMARLRELDLVDVLRTLDRPLLGVCVGVQLLFAHSEEDDTPCLGLLTGRVRKLHAAPGIRVPHMGWNTLQRRALVTRLAGVVALCQTDHAAIAHVDGGIHRETCHCSPYSMKFFSSRAPTAPERSGWNCAPATLPRCTTAAKRWPCSLLHRQSSSTAAA